jgi:hypothetical protein
VTASNCYDLTEIGSQGTKLDAEAAETGELCYKVNNGGSNWYQTLDTDEHPTFDDSKPSVYEIAVSSAGYASFVPTVSIATLPAGVKAYVGQIQNNGSSLHLKEVTALPADNAFVVNAAEGNYYYNNTSEAVTLSESNDLDFYDVATAATGTQYCLANKEPGVGFYQVESGIIIPARKVYLTVSSPVKAFYGFEEDDATAVEMVNAQSSMVNGSVYNLAGQRIQKMQKGINIINGKKVLY